MDLAEAVSTFLRILPQAIVSGVALGSVYALIAQGYYVTFTAHGCCPQRSGRPNDR